MSRATQSPASIPRKSATGDLRHDFSRLFSIGTKPIGSGSNADVFLADVIQDGSDEYHHLPAAAVKVLHPREETAYTSDSLPAAFKREVELMILAQDHPNLVRFLGLFLLDQPLTSGPRFAIVLEYYPGGDLFDRITKSVLSERSSRVLMKGLLSALAHLQSLNIIHRDVKVENVLLSAEGRPVLADLGIACFVDDEKEMARRCGSPGYMAPETLQATRAIADFKADVFSCGVVLFMALCGMLPFSGSTLASTLRKTLKAEPDFTMSQKFKEVSPACLDHVRWMLEKSPQNRPFAQEALSADWLQNAGRSSIPQDEETTSAKTKAAPEDEEDEGGPKPRSSASLTPAATTSRPQLRTSRSLEPGHKGPAPAGKQTDQDGKWKLTTAPTPPANVKPGLGQRFGNLANSARKLRASSSKSRESSCASDRSLGGISIDRGRDSGHAELALPSSGSRLPGPLRALEATLRSIGSRVLGSRSSSMASVNSDSERPSTSKEPAGRSGSSKDARESSRGRRAAESSEPSVARSSGR